MNFKWKHILFYALGILANLLLETVFLPSYNIAGIRPDTVIAAVVCIGILRGSASAGAYGMVTGFLIDILYSPYMGYFALPYSLIGFTAGLFSQQMYAQNLAFPTAFSAVATLLKEAILGLETRVVGYKTVANGAFFRYFVPEALFTAVVTLIVFYFLRAQLRKQWKRSRWEGINTMARFDE